MLKNILLVGLGGGVGSMMRYLTSALLLKYRLASFPAATFAVNIAGCLLIGCLIALLGKAAPANDDLRLLLIAGFCGGYTTFSTFSAENLDLLQSGQYLTLALYVAGSVLLGILAVWAGYQMCR